MMLCRWLHEQRWIVLILVLNLWSSNAWSQAPAAMQITGVVHGGLAGAPKALECFVLEDIDDLSEFGLGTANNGSGSAGVEWTFPPMAVQAGEFLYVSKESEIFASFFGFEADFIDDGLACNFNGDDAIELFQNDWTIDAFGDPNLDGSGFDWEYTLGWAWRSCESMPSAVFNGADWTVSMGAFGASETNAAAMIPFPAGEFANPCIELLPGCTESHADNYNPLANEEDGSCSYVLFFSASGCTYDQATNFDAQALFDDGTCEWSSTNPCPADLNDNGLVDVSDVLLMLTAFGQSCPEEEAVFLTGTGQFVFDGYAPFADTPINLHYHVPAGLTSEAPVVMVFHGNNRNASEYRDHWISIADAMGLLIIAPEFTSSGFPGSEEYMQGGVFNADGVERPVAQWTFALVEPMLVAFQDSTGNGDPKMDLWGHSAGGQFVHRFMLFHGSELVDRAVAANSGWYTVPDLPIAYPYGLLDAPVNGRTLDEAMSSQLIISLGTADTNSIGPIHNPDVDLQGFNRFDRGQYFWELSQNTAESQALELNWNLMEEQGVGHDASGMADAAAAWLFP